MLQRTLARHAANRLAAVPYAICSCTCGSLFRSHASPQKHSRRALSREAPSTSRKRRREKGRALTPQQARERQKEQEEYRELVYNVLVQTNKLGLTSMDPNDGVPFLNDFAELAGESPGRNAVNAGKFEMLVAGYKLRIHDPEVFMLCLILRDNTEEAERNLGRKMMYTLSAAGHAEATITIMSHAYLGHKLSPQVLRASDILFTRGRLRDLARRDQNYRAMVLEGKIAYALGDEGYAIEMWHQAMSACVAQSEREAALGRRNSLKELSERLVTRRRDRMELSTPWIELTLAHWERYERLYRRNEIVAALAELEKARSAMEVGCEQDDPTSHYHAAALFSEEKEDGSTRYTSSWLYHMSKAGATGHAKAAHALAEFYALTPWKYIEDEPPDHLKPTPFDSCPATTSPVLGFFSTLKRMAGFGPKTTSSSLEAAQADIFHTAAFPSTPVDRWKLAVLWLTMAMNQRYAPSYLLAAKMLLEDTLGSQVQAPKSAIMMTDARYTYASKADYEAGTPIIREPTPPGTSNSDADSAEIPNPGYSPTDNPLEAQAHLRQIFYAHTAHKLRQDKIARTREALRQRRISGIAEDALADSDRAARDAPRFIQPWMSSNIDAFVREMWEHEIEGLVKEARRICERKGWDLVDEEGGLLHKCGIGGT